MTGVPPDLKDGFRLEIRDDAVFEAGIEDLIRFHGTGSLCGLCLTWALVRQFCRDAGIKFLTRRDCRLKIGARGPGIHDAVEYLFRAWDDGRAVLNRSFGEAWNAPEAPSDGGRFAFELAPEGTESVILVLKDEFVPHEYFRLCEKKNADPEGFREEEARKTLQLEFARRMLETPEPFRRI